MAEPLLQLDLNTWIEIQASTASLDRGSHGLLPQADRLNALGIHPKRAGDEPLAESWAGEAPDGYAQVSVLQIDKRHLPARLLLMLGERPVRSEGPRAGKECVSTCSSRLSPYLNKNTTPHTSYITKNKH